MVTLRTLLGSLLACAILFSCTKETEQPMQPVQETGMYTLTVSADKGDRADTKALGFDSGALKASWTQGDTVSVYKGSALLGLVMAQASGKETVLSGKILGEIVKGDELTLTYLSPDYSHQDGTIEYIASHCDYAVATVTVSDIGETTASTTAAIFANQQAIVKFTLNVSAKPLSITLPGQCLAVTPESAQSVLYVALPALSSQAVSMMAAANEKVYVKNVDNVTLEAGKYYAISATLTESSSSLLVHNEAELRAAVQTNNAQILFANDIPTASLLEITNSRTVTINMAGYTLDRGCTSRGSQVIVVRSGSRLDLSGGKVSGGWGGNGGALDIESGATVNLTNVTINGGAVIAEAGKNATGLRAIGPGYGSDDYGQLSLGDYMMVKSERMAKEAERKNMCWYRTQVRVEPCTHPGYTAETCPYHVHD